MHLSRPCCALLLIVLATAVIAAPAQIHYRHASGKWLPLPCRMDADRGVVSFTLDPQVIGGGATTVVLGARPGVVLDDEQPPRITGLKLDSQAVRVTPVTDLDWLATHPEEITIGVADAHNALDLQSLRLQVNGIVLMPDQYRAEISGRGKTLRIVLPAGDLLRRQNQFKNALVLRVADVSPQHNTTTCTLTYRHVGEITQSPALLVDSSYSGYEDLAVLTDGKVMEPGNTTYGVTWAAEEVPGDHWLVFAWPQERTVSAVEVFWATYGGTFHAPQRLLVQTWDGKQWVTQQTLEGLKAQASTAIEFGPVKTTRLRLLQPDGQGHPVRPNIMWITEVKVP